MMTKSALKCEKVEERSDEGTMLEHVTVVIPKVKDAKESQELASLVCSTPLENKLERDCDGCKADILTKEHTNYPDIQDVLQEFAATNEALRNCQEELIQANKTIKELKDENSKLMSAVKLENGIAAKWKNYWSFTRAQYDKMKTCTDKKLQTLCREMYSLKNRARESELLILDLKVVVSKSKIDAKISEASFCMQKLSIVINQSRSCFTSSALHKNYAEFYDYKNQCFNVKMCLEANYQSLRYKIKNNCRYNMSEIGVRIPPLPQLCRQVSVLIEDRSQLNNECVLPPYTEYEAPPPYSRYETPPDNQGLQDEVPPYWENELPGDRESELPSYRESEVPPYREATQTDEFVAEAGSEKQAAVNN